MNGPVVFEIAPGDHEAFWRLAPIPGASATSTVTYMSPTPLAAKLSSPPFSAVILHIDDYTDNFPVSWVVIDGLEFRLGGGPAIIANGSCTDIEIRNCVFSGKSIHINGQGRAKRWSFHHNTAVNMLNKFLRFDGVEEFDIHHNTIQASAVEAVISLTPLGDGSGLRTRIYNNVISNALGTGPGPGAASGLLLGHSVDVDHNTVWVHSGLCLTLYGTPTGKSNLFNNVLVTELNWQAIQTSTTDPLSVDLDGNLYFSFDPSSINQGPPSADTFAQWQANTGFDANSIHADPLFVDVANPPIGLRLVGPSPGMAAAVNTRPWITDDVEGTPRSAQPSIGAYESSAALDFTTFGVGCPGSGGFVPAIGSSGEVRWGSTDFAITLSNALGGPGVNAYLVIGTSTTTWAGGSLPYDFGGGCELLVGPTIQFGVAVGGGTGPGNGQASFPINLPTDPLFLGMQAHIQWGVIDPQAAGIGLAMSNAATLSF